MTEDRDDRFEREPRVSLPSTETWAPFQSTLDEELDDGEEEPAESRYARSQLAFHERYEVLGTLAAGGMSEIRLCRDRPFSREIAMKVLRQGPSSKSGRWRFFNHFLMAALHRAVTFA